ncbi:MAG: translation initiation factor IF-3 [Ruminococcaceae bacterium]|nr:translation initiation factor IF-3 [Oscillospiraceae bacterium]
MKNNNAKELTINEDIKAVLHSASVKQVRLIGSDGEQLGLIDYEDALEKAYDEGMDLVLMASQAVPPVCKIMDYGKFRFERDKKEKEAKKKQQIADVKEIQLSCLIDTNDFNTKVNHARRFLTGGDKVKVIVKFKGRQMSHQSIGVELLEKFKDACSDIGVVEKNPVLEGRFMTMFISPQKQNNK